MSEVDDQRYIRQLEAERDALKVELALVKAGEAQALEAACEHRAEVERLRRGDAALREKLAHAKRCGDIWDEQRGMLEAQLTELRAAALALQPKMDVSDPAWAKVEWTRIEALRVVLAKLKP